MAQLGHYGTPALIAVITAVALLVVHLAVPFALRDFSQAQNDIGIEDDVLTRGDMVDEYDAVDGPGGAAPGTILTGIILALVGSVLLFVTGFVPAPILVARFAGWFFAFFAAIGGFIATLASAHWVGTGFTTFLRVVIPTNAEPASRFWTISPVLTMAGAIVLVIFAIKTMAGVVSTRDGLRDQASRQLKGSIIAVILACCVLALPWSMQILNGDERRAAGFCSGGETCDPTYVFFTAFGHGDHAAGNAFNGANYGGILGIADSTSEFDPALFQGLAFSISVMVATAWVLFILSAVATLGPLMSSAFKLPAAARMSPIIQMLTLPMLAWAAIQFILAATYQWKPSYDDAAQFAGTIADQTWIPGVLGLATGVFIVMAALNQIGAVKGLFANMGGIEKVTERTHSFD